MRNVMARIRFPSDAWDGVRGMPKDVYRLAWVALINSAGTMVMPFLALYLSRKLGFGPGHTGAVIACYGVGAIAAGPLSGRLADRIGASQVMKTALMGSGVAMLSLPFLWAFWQMAAVAVLWGLTSAAFRPASYVAVAHMVSDSQRKSAYSLIRIAINLGYGVGPAIAGVVATWSYTWLFVIDGATALAAGGALAYMFGGDKARRLDVPRFSHKTEPAAAGETGKPGNEKGFGIFLVAMFLNGLVFFQIQGALPLFVVGTLGLSPVFFGFLFTINTLVVLTLELPISSLTRNWPARQGMTLGALLFALGSALLGVSHAPWQVGASFLVWSLGEVFLFPQSAAHASHTGSRSQVGHYMGLYAMTFSLAFAIGPWAGINAHAAMDARILWGVIAAVGIVTALIFNRVREPARKDGPEEPLVAVAEPVAS